MSTNLTIDWDELPQAQHWDSPIAPYRRLWAAVLLNAIREYKNGGYRRSILAWVNANRRGPGSFLFISDIVGISRDQVLRALATEGPLIRKGRGRPKKVLEQIEDLREDAMAEEC